MEINESANSAQAPPHKTALFWRVHDAVLNASTAALLVGILLLMVLQISTRYIFNNPLKWTEEYTRYCQVWLTFLGGVVMIRDHSTICIDAIVNLLPKKVQKHLWLLSTLLSLIFLVVLAVYGIKFVIVNAGAQALVSGVNMGVIYSVIPVSAVLMLLNMLRVLKEAPECKY